MYGKRSGKHDIKLTKQSIVAIEMLCAVLSVLLIYNSNASASTLRLSTFNIFNSSSSVNSWEEQR